MFSGRYEHTIDEKGRLNIPARFRDLFIEHSQGKLVLTCFDSCIEAYPLDEWRHLEEKLKSLSLFQKDVRTFSRLVYASAAECSLDSQGRILIPANLREMSQLGRDVILVGVSNRMEIWSQERWEAFFGESSPHLPQLAQKLAELGL